MFLSASIVFGSSRRGGIRSIASSVMLKSPSRKFGAGSPQSRLSVSMSAHSVCCAALLLGAYTFIIDVASSSNHSIFSIMTLPGSISWNVVFLGAMRDLLRIRATPAVVRGASGSVEKKISIFFTEG